MSTISTTISHGITLGSGGYTSPLIVTNTGGVNNTGVAIYSSSGGTLVNSGNIRSTTSYAVEGGVYLLMTNAAGGVVTGYLAGVRAASASLVNRGTIKETGNSGTGVYLNDTGPDGMLTNYGLVSAVYRGVLFRGSASLDNQGTIASTGRYGVQFNNASTSTATVTNNGLISGNNNGLVFVDTGDLNNTGQIVGLNALALRGTGSIGNSGTIDATYGTGIVLGSGIISNASAGLITQSGSYSALYVDIGAATIVNAGTIAGFIGITIATSDAASQTVIDTGTIAGTGGTAIAFGSANDLLRFDPSAKVAIQGTVDGGGGTNTLLFTSAASSGTLTGQGAVFTNFSQGSVATGAQWTVAGNVTLGTGVTLSTLGTLTVAGTLSSGTDGVRLLGGTIIDSGTIAGTAPIDFGTGVNLLTVGTSAAAITGTIAGFTGIHDTIDLKGLSDSGNNATTSFNTLTHVLTVTGSSGSVQLHLGSGSYTGNAWAATNDGTNGTLITPICFLPGTAIATPDGEKPIERLAVGDLVLTASGQARPIVWIGTGRVLATRGQRGVATPVIVRKGALAPNVPNRDLHVTKAHALYIDDVLIPVEFLVNHRTIVWDDRAQEVEFFHVELATHDILIANGAPAESYREDGNRWMFRNARTGAGLPPHEPFAPILTGGPIVDAAWQRLLDRAGPHEASDLTDDPDLHLIVDGVRIDARQQRDKLYVFQVPARPKSVIVASRSGVPSELGIARDPRTLGVALRQITISHSWKLKALDAADERLTMGFHGYEPSERLRWTNGHAALPIEAFARFDNGSEVTLYLGGKTRYRADDRAGRSAA
jgi:hypothetical protein